MNTATAQRLGAATSVDFHDTLSRVINAANSDGSHCGRIIVVDLDPELRAARLIDRQQAFAAASALVRAAAEKATPGSALRFKAQAFEAQVRVTITASYLPHLNLEPSRARTAAKEAGGRLDVAGQGDGVITWSLVLPAPLAPPSVLVIDDDRLARFALAEALRAAGFVPEATNGEDGLLRLLSGRRYEAVLVDLWLEEVDPFELGRLACGPAFAMTDRYGQLGRWALTAAGFQGLLIRPLSMGQLRKALNMTA